MGRIDMMRPETAREYIDGIAALKGRERENLYSSLKGKDPKEVYFTDKDLYAMMTLAYGPELARGFVEHRENEQLRRQRLLEVTDNRDQAGHRLKAYTGDHPLYKEYHNEREVLDTEVKSLHEQEKDAWKSFARSYSFENTSKDAAFLTQQKEMA